MKYLVDDKHIKIKENSADCRVLKYVTDVEKSYVIMEYCIKRLKTVGQVNIFKLELLFSRLNKRPSINGLPCT